MLLEKSGWYCLVGSFGIFGWEVFFVGPVMFQWIWNADMMLLLFHSWVMSLQVYFCAPSPAVRLSYLSFMGVPHGAVRFRPES